MKKQSIKALLLGALVLLTLAFTSQKQSNDKSLAQVNKTNNKYIFFYSEPVAEYEIAFTFVNTIENINSLSPQEMFNESIKNANIESANHSKFYDAIIIGNSDRDMAISFKTKGKDDSIAKVKKIEGILIFAECEPITLYEIVEKHNVSGMGSHEKKINKLIKRSESSKKPFDAIIYGSSKNDLSIKFK